MLANIPKVISTIFLSLATIFGGNVPAQPVIIYQTEPQADYSHEIQALGANISALADFHTSLASGISSSATSMTLVSFTSGSDTLTQGAVYGFKIGGSEYVVGTASTSNQIVNMTRGLSRKTGTSTVTAYQQTWGRGTPVEMTDAPILLDHANKLTGITGFDSPIKYDSAVATTTFTDPQQIIDKGYADSLAFNGAAVINANTTSKGVVEIATATEVSSSTATGSTGATLVIPASQASSTWTSAALAAGKIPVAQPNTGKIDSGFISTSTLFVGVSLTGTTTTASTTVVGSTNALDIGKTRFIATTSTTFTAPSGVKKIFVQVQAPGGYGGWGDSGAGGGASGSYSEMYIDLSATSSTSFAITISSATSTFSSYIICPGGGSAISSTAGVAPAACTGGDFKVNGRQGRVVSAGFAAGADSFLGIGGAGKTGGAEDGSGYGSGGGGTNSGIGIGGTPAPGIVLITY